MQVQWVEDLKSSLSTTYAAARASPLPGVIALIHIAAHHHWAFTTIEAAWELNPVSLKLLASRRAASMVALGPFTQEVVGASIRTSRDTAACGVGWRR